MSRKRKKTKRSNKKKNKNMDLTVVALIVLSIMLAVLIYTKSGYIGEVLSPMLGGIIGWIKYIVPVGTFLIAIYLACEKKEYVLSKLSQYIIFLLCVSVIMSIFQLSKGNIDINNDFTKVIEDAYYIGERNVGGGAIGIIIAIPLVKLLGMFGAAIFSIGIAVILIIFIFDIKLSEVIIDIVEDIELKREEKNKSDDEEKTEEKRMKLRDNKKEISKKKKKNSIDIPLDEEDEQQIKINLNGKTLKKYKHEEELKPNTVNSKEEVANLFKKEEEKKEDKTREVLQLQHTITVEDEHYEFPSVQLLQEGETIGIKGGKKAITDNATKLQRTLHSFGVSAKVENVSVGPSITRYELNQQKEFVLVKLLILQMILH